MLVKNFLFVFFLLQFVCVLANPEEIAKLLEEARELKANGKDEDAIECYEEIVTNYDVSLLNTATLLEIRKELAYYYFSEKDYPKAQNFFKLLIRHRIVKDDDEFQDMIYKLCISIYSQIYPCADVELKKCYELRNAFNTYSKYVKDEHILEDMKRMFTEALHLLDEQKCLYAEYYFDIGKYDSALFLCNRHLQSVKDDDCCKRLLLLKLRILLEMDNFQGFISFYNSFRDIKERYPNIYRGNRREFDELYSIFEYIWKERRAPLLI